MLAYRVVILRLLNLSDDLRNVFICLESAENRAVVAYSYPKRALKWVKSVYLRAFRAFAARFLTLFRSYCRQGTGIRGQGQAGDEARGGLVGVLQGFPLAPAVLSFSAACKPMPFKTMPWTEEQRV